MTHRALDEPVLAEARRVHVTAERELGQVLADLATWVNTDTPGGDVSAVDRFAAELAHTVEPYGIRAELVPAGDRGLYFHGVVEGSGSARVALLCHHDTVFPHGTAEARPFRQDGACCHGPGVADMKGGLAVAVHAARLLAFGPRPFARIEVVSVPDEESRPNAPETIDRLAGFDAVLCLECGRPDGEVVSARKGAKWFRLQAHGHPAHAGVEPDVGRNAIHALSHEATRLLGLHHARVGLTLQLTSMVGGEGLNTVPSRASLTADMRAITAADLDWGFAEAAAVGAHDGIDFRLDDLGGPPAFERTPHVAALAEAAILIGAELGHPFGEALTGGVSDGSWTAHHGLPTLDGLGPVGGLDHGPNEYIETATIASRCGVVAGLVAAVDAGLLDDVA